MDHMLPRASLPVRHIEAVNVAAPAIGSGQVGASKAMGRNPRWRRVVVKCPPTGISARPCRHRTMPRPSAMFRPSLGNGRRKRQTQDGRR